MFSGACESLAYWPSDLPAHRTVIRYKRNLVVTAEKGNRISEWISLSIPQVHLADEDALSTSRVRFLSIKLAKSLVCRPEGRSIRVIEMADALVDSNPEVR